MTSIVPKQCIVCGSEPFDLIANGLPMWRCPTCGLMWRQSFNVPIAHYAEAPGGFSKEKEKLQRRNIADRICALGKYIRLDYTCDIGGSKGYFVEGLIRSGYQWVYGIDPNKIQVEAARARGVPMIVGSTEDLKNIFTERKTENVTLFHVIEHLPDPIKVLSEIRDALPFGGYLIVETPDFDAWSFKRLHYKHRLVYDEHLFYFNANSLCRLLEKNGFHVVRMWQRDFDQYHLAARESLFRLGLMKREGDLSLRRRVFLKFANIFLTRVLSFLVKIAGRGNFILVVAKKTEE